MEVCPQRETFLSFFVGLRGGSYYSEIGKAFFQEVLHKAAYDIFGLKVARVDQIYAQLQRQLRLVVLYFRGNIDVGARVVGAVDQVSAAAAAYRRGGDDL